MKYILIIVLVLFVALTATMCGVKVDMWEQDATSHTFGWWPNGFKKLKTEPTKTVTIPIAKNGNYLGNPSTIKFAQYLAVCVVDTSYMHVHKYLQFIRN